MKKTIGILGGMGPEATLHMQGLILKKTKAQKDQDHIKTIVFSNPEVPPRTDAILKTGPSPVPYLVEGVKALIQAGADFIIMPCVTAHYFIPEVQAQIQFQFLSLLEESLKWTLKNIPGIKRAGIIASTGTLESKLFHDAFKAKGIEISPPTDKEQDQVMEAIFGEKGIKAGYTTGSPRDDIIRIAHDLIQRGAEAIIAGCTEVPLVLNDRDIPVPRIEPLEIAAEASVIAAGYELE